MKGRKKVPDQLKKIRGTDQPCRMNPNQPKPSPITDISGAECPLHLQDDDVARITWDWAVSTLKDMRVLTTADLLTIEQYCTVYSDLRELRANLKKYGRIAYTIKMDSMGNEITEAKSNPAAVQYNNLLTQFRGFTSMLGLDPTSRPRLKVPDEKSKNDLEDFANG